jgi:asparagine synthase (glutamine-hydrolysing)
VSLTHTGYHVLRGKDPRSFGAFRCGSILDRFSQIDMLHLDVWWRGQNVLIDGGSYLYNGPSRWHNHFLRTGSHNTVQVDGAEQMPHIRQFKTILPTAASLLRFEDYPDWACCEGEHYGYMRDRDSVHHRSVLFVKDDLWVVVDTVTGSGWHSARLHWLAGDYPYQFDPLNSELSLETPLGDFGVAVLDGSGKPFQNCDVVKGDDVTPRGWTSRYYGEKAPVPSLVATTSGSPPLVFVSVLCPGRPAISVDETSWSIHTPETNVRFRIEDGRFENISVNSRVSSPIGIGS